MAEVDELRDALEREYPRLDQRSGDWDDVLRRATTARPRRRTWTVRLLLAGAALAALVIALIAPWRSDSGIVGRASAALGDGPVIHVVLRAGTKAHRVDLRTGVSRPVYEEQELWWDPSRGLHQIARFDGMAYADSLTRSLPPPEADPLPLGFTTGYRKALESGKAKVIGDGEIHGHKVTWIRFSPGGGVTFDVAVDRTSAKPVFTRYTAGGDRTFKVERTVLLAESLPRGSGDFDVKPVPQLNKLVLGGGGSGVGTRVVPGRAVEILRRAPLWLGPRYAGTAFKGFLPAFVLRGHGLKNRRDFGVEAVYGQAFAFSPNPGKRVWARVGQYPRLRFEIGFMEPNEGKIWRAARAGSLLVYETGDTLPGGGLPAVAGYTRRNGLYVKVMAPSSKLVVSAARALRPLRPQ